MPGWVTLAELGQIRSLKTKQAVIDSLLPLKKLHPQAIVLACTHYLIFKSSIRKVFPQVKIFDPSLAVAAQVARLHTGQPPTNPIITIFSTKNTAALKLSAANLLPFPVKLQSIVI
jgi:glutamate racemase